jgi:hypothetical protein
MKYIKLLEDFNKKKVARNFMMDNYSLDTLYRTTTYDWLIDLIKNKSIISKRSFISFSRDENSGQGDNSTFGDIRIDFEAKEIIKQGAIEIEYTPEFFDNYPDICMYVTGYKNEESYVKTIPNGYEEPWDEFINSFSSEEEVVIPKLKMTTKLIKKVTIWDADQRTNIQEMKDTLEGYGLNVDIPWND